MQVRAFDRSALIGAAVALLWASAGPVVADRPDSLREALVGSRAQDGRDHKHTPPVARYVSETGANFVFDRSGRAALLKFERSQEIWALHPSPGPNGDVIYKNDLGQPVVRFTRLGGLTVFTRERPTGVPASLAGEAVAFKAPQMSPQALVQTMARSSARASKSAKRLIPFHAPSVSQGAEFLFADAAMVAAEAVARLAATANGRDLVTAVKQVRLIPGRKSDARLLKDGTLEVVVAPQNGLAGRPSSGKLVRTIAQR
ncbi:MAG TPA: DUF4908 domain-containing protein [Caulobacteraceae bacterium]|nr:DUF4908 domain-containing protein [Caulobacteraceae bacterium]